MATYPTNPALPQGVDGTDVDPTNWNKFVDNINAIGADLVDGRGDGQTFPGTDHTASQSTDIDDALQAIRHMIADITGETNWYDQVDIALATIASGAITFGNDDATPSVATAGRPVGMCHTATGNSTSLNVTDLDDGNDSQIMIVVGGNNSNKTTLKAKSVDPTSSLILRSDWQEAEDTCILLIYDSAASEWYEVSRSPEAGGGGGGDDNDLTTSDASGGAQTVNLPTAVGKLDHLYAVTKTDNSSYTVTVDPDGTETINAATTWVMRRQYESVSMLSDGSNWRRIAASGAILNVRDFGAKGDGSTDDYTAFNNAMTAAQANDTIYVPASPTAYMISATLTNSNNLQIVGDGPKSMIFMSGDYDLFDTTPAGFFSYRNLRLGSAATTAGKCIIKTSNLASFGTIEDVWVEGGYYCIGLYGTLFVTIRGLVATSGFPKTTSQAQAVIYAVYSGGACNALCIINPRIQPSPSKAVNGIYIDDQQGEGTFSVIGGLIEAVGTDGIYAYQSCEGGTIQGVHFENNTKGIHLNTCRNIQITGCYVDSSPGLHLDNCANIRFGECWTRSPQVDSDCRHIILENLRYETGMDIQGNVIKQRNNVANADTAVGGYGMYDGEIDTNSRANTNGDLEEWTGAVPDGYDTVGTVAEETTTFRSGSSAAKLTAGASGWNCLRYALEVYKFKNSVKPISIQAWVYRPAASTGTLPRLGMYYNDWTAGWTKTFTVPADTWTPICATFYPPASGTYTSMRVIVGSYNSTENDILYMDDITISETQF